MTRNTPVLRRRFVEQCETRRKSVLSLLARQAADEGEEQLIKAVEEAAWEVRALGTEASLLGFANIEAVADILFHLMGVPSADVLGQIGRIAGWCDRLTRVAAALVEGERLDQAMSQLELLRDEVTVGFGRAESVSDGAGGDGGEVSSGRRVLILDDSELGREALAMGLQEQGFRTAVSADLAEFARQVVLFEPDAIVADVMMPGLDGDDICRVLKRNFDLPTTPVVLVSTLPAHVLRARAELAGADGYVTKDEGTDELARVLEGLLARLNQPA